MELQIVHRVLPGPAGMAVVFEAVLIPTKIRAWMLDADAAVGILEKRINLDSFTELLRAKFDKRSTDCFLIAVHVVENNTSRSNRILVFVCKQGMPMME